ncbi:MAG TPA: hypothetical protein VGI46_02070 [Candidatus Acidoferrum sp.]
MVIGVGFAGSILAEELAASGLKVVGIERGKERHTVHALPQDFSQEAKNCLANVSRVLEDSGMDYSNVVSVHRFISSTFPSFRK